MASGSGISRIVADTDSLLFWGDSDFLADLFTNVGITTTNACVGEVSRHANKGNNSRFGVAALSKDDQRRKRAAENILPYIDPNRSSPQGISDADITINAEFCGSTGLGHKEGGGEESIANLVSQYTNAVEVIAMMDSGRNKEYYERGGRELVKTSITNWDSQQISFVSPASVIALLEAQGVVGKSAICSDLARLIEQEGWPDTAWHDVPIDCSQGPDFLPDSFG